jgi:hypothetical protein
VLGKAERMQAICRKHDTPLAAAALQFPLAEWQAPWSGRVAGSRAQYDRGFG